MIRSLSLGVLFSVVVALHGQPGKGPRSAPKPADNKAGWTVEELFQQLARQPNDPYLQYVAVQLARLSVRRRETGWRAGAHRGDRS